MKLTSQLRGLSGVCLFLGLIVTVVNAFIPFFSSWLGGTFLWIAGLILFFDIDARQKKIIFTISSLAFISWFIAWKTEHAGDFVDVISVNQTMIVMLIGVQFLQLVTSPGNGVSESLPKGENAFIKTYLGVHFFGSVINMSAVFLVADRWVKEGALSNNQLKLLTRAFPSGANWSPFFAAFAAALVFTPDASLLVLISVGSGMACIAFLLTWFEVKKDKIESLDRFVGYPVKFNALWLPAMLVLFVFISQVFLPSIKVLVLIAICAVVISLLVLIARKGLSLTRVDFQHHVIRKLPKMKGELLLFLIAGVFGSGVSAAMDGLSIGIPIEHFDGIVALVVLFFMLSLAIVGVHPVISIAVIGHWMASVNPDHTLLAMTFLMAWAIGVTINPISGINLALQGRYNASVWNIFIRNLPYAIKMYAAASLALILTSYLLQA